MKCKRKKRDWIMKMMDGPVAGYEITIKDAERPPAVYSIPWVVLKIFRVARWCGVEYEICPPTGPDFIPYRLSNISWAAPVGFCPLCGQRERKGKK